MMSAAFFAHDRRRVGVPPRHRRHSRSIGHSQALKSKHRESWSTTEPIAHVDVGWYWVRGHLEENVVAAGIQLSDNEFDTLSKARSAR